MTTSNSIRDSVLLVDDEASVLMMLSELLSDEFTTRTASSGKAAVDAVTQDRSISVVVMDIKMPGMDGITAAREIRRIAPQVAIIFHTGYPGEYNEDEIDRSEKPFDYVLKGEAISRLMRAVRNAVESQRLRRQRLSDPNWGEAQFGIIGRSQSMYAVFEAIRKVAVTDAKVMILGETGTGKELVARAIHAHSPRRDGPFAIFNCNHKSPDLVESELFGHLKGSFTGAIAERVGLFEYANAGTVFLDEIGDLDITTQAKILRVLETGEYSPVGTNLPQQTDVRVLCATHKDLRKMVECGSFREDLFYRLKGVTITIPPLRERREDIPLLAERFKDRFTVESGGRPKFYDPTAIDLLIQSDWLGNVRGLMGVIQTTITMSESDLIMASDIAAAMEEPHHEIAAANGSLESRIREFERTVIVSALSKSNNNLSAAARELKVDPSNLRRKLISLGIAHRD